ncbi:MSHA biogenesis protein MshQ [Vibrio chagasii]|nr:MSHA biogenesis protein MshQ [Vibrio chagasii]
MIKQFSVFLVVLFLSPLVQGSINTNPQFEFGTISADQCTITGPSVSCNLDFSNTYAAPPLVFVMATVNSSRSNFNLNTTEYPSDLRVMSVSTSGASIKQLLPPTTKACVRMKPGGKCGNPNNPLHKAVTYVDAPMENIDYLVIEPGVLEFDNGAKIVAGEVSYNKTYSNAGGWGNNNKTVRFSDFGLNQSFNSSPGVLVQIQTVQNSTNDSPLWLTPIALNPSRSAFSLVLDRSEVSRNSYSITPEKVGFVAGLGQGFVNGRKFWLGQGSTKQTTTLNDNIIKPITEGCKLVSPFSVSGFTSTPTLLASKRTRNGNNGGWLRRCSVSKTGVSLINEEDMTKDPERGHVVEPFSYFLFDKPPLSEICELFPSPAQTWTSNNQASLTIENNANISGAPISGGKRYIGFAQSDVTDRKSQGCDGAECFGDTGLRVTKQQLESFQAPDPGLETVTVQNNQTRVFQNNESIGTLTINNNATLIFKTGTYWVDSINAIGDIEIPPGNVVEIHTKGFALSNGSNFSALDNGELTVYVHDLSYNGGVIHSWVDLANNSKFVGLLYSEKSVILSNNAVVEGAVTAKTITLNNGSEIIATNKCFEPADDYEIDISPATNLALMCGDDSPQFTINTSNNGVAESLGVTVGITPDANEFDVSVLKGSGTYPNYVSNDDGQLTLKVVANNTANIDFDTGYKLTAILVDDSGKEVESQFKFVPFKFSLMDGDNPTNRLDVIAGQATPTVTKVLACDSGDSIVVAENYTGEAGDEVTIAHELDSSWSGSDGSLTYLPEFKEGSATTDLTISESGLFNVTLKDSSFDCTGFAGCPEDGSYDVEGSFAIYSRPWKFAICTNKGSDGNSKDKDSDSFTGAREAFDVYARPIKYTDSSDVCSDDGLLTNNYFESTASVKVTTTLDTPSATDYPDAELGELTPEARLTKQISPNDRSNKGYKFDGLRYSEVGSFNFIATETGSFYSSILGGFKGSKSIGRFYPKYFLQENPEWNVANQNDIAYLSQSYDSSVHQVYPMASGESGVGNALNNYRFFHSDLQAKFGVLDDTAIDNEFLLDTGAGTWSTDRKHWLLNDGAAVLKRVTDSDGVSRKDNPFNTSDANSTVTHFGLTIDGVDPVSFTDSDTLTDSAEFLVQPPARYGRMALDDIGGNSGTTLTIPLRAEFWDGSEFVVNDDDSRSAFDGSKACKQVIWHSDGAITTLASLNGSGSVDDGEEEVTANQNTPAGTDTPREQVRLWLRMGDSKPSKKTGENDISCSTDYEDQPWLQYNWRQLGDEDPSTVVTFGIYRGNDRVIYRGESGLTGQ